MKAFLLAAGVGSRLRPVTNQIPKCMLRFGQRTLLEIWLDAFCAAGVEEVLVNVHHLPELVTRHLAALSSGSPTRPSVRTVFEPQLLGSAGTLLANEDWIGDERYFLACNADNLTDFELGTLVERHSRGDALATLGVFRSERPSQCGIVEVDSSGRVVGFEEKPARPRSDLANAGMYVFDPTVLELLAGDAPLDIGTDLLPRLVGRAVTVVVEGYFRDIGTPEAYRCAQADWSSRVPR